MRSLRLNCPLSLSIRWANRNCCQNIRQKLWLKPLRNLGQNLGRNPGRNLRPNLHPIWPMMRSQSRPLLPGRRALASHLKKFCPHPGLLLIRLLSLNLLSKGRRLRRLMLPRSLMPQFLLLPRPK